MDRKDLISINQQAHGASVPHTSVQFAHACSRKVVMYCTVSSSVLYIYCIRHMDSYCRAGSGCRGCGDLHGIKLEQSLFARLTERYVY